MTLDIREQMARVPEVARFPTVDELHAALAGLAARHPGLVRQKRVGTSRLGEPILLTSLGDDLAGDAPNAFVFGMPHPNEPIGMLTVLELTRRLCDDAELRRALGYTWHVIPVADPDGTRLNEGWFGGPFTRGHYARHFYRPAPDQQVEWTFPFSYKRAYFDRVLPETQALMRVIDELRPAFMFSLHNAEHGGVYYYISRPAAPLYQLLQDIPGWEGLPLHLGEPELPMLTPVAPAVFVMPSSEELYDFTERFGGDPTATRMGGSSDSYAKKYGTFGLVVEMPYWDDPRANDTTPTDSRRRAALLAAIADGRAFLEFLRTSYAVVEPDLKSNSPFRATIVATLGQLGEMYDQMAAWAEASDDTVRPATVAELYSARDLTHVIRLRDGGQYLRLLDGELAIGNGTPAIRAQRAAAAERFDAWLAEAEADEQGQPIPIRKLVAVQLGAALATAAWLREA